MTSLDALLWRATERLAALPTFPALVFAFVAAAVICVGALERPM